MCTLMIDNQSRLIAWTGQQVNLKAEDGNMTRSQKRRAQRKKAQSKGVTENLNVIQEEAQEAEILPLFSGHRIPVRISAQQHDLRFHRNCTKKTINSGKKITTPTEFVDLGQGVLEEVAGQTYYEGKVRKYFFHDSHGKHGRKPRYKDNHVII